MRRKLFPVSLAVGVLALAVLLGYFGFFSDSVSSQAQSQSLNVAVALTPNNGTHLVAGEVSEVVITLKDKTGAPVSKDDLSTLALYAYGPQEPQKTISAVKLLNATADRSQTPHHYIDLLTNPATRFEGNTAKYTLQPVSDEEPGTYTLAVRAQKKNDPPSQVFGLADFQLLTTQVETQVVRRENCAACHQGAANGQFYFAHVDTSERSPFGSPSLDSWPVRTCKACHNNEGYAAYRGNIDAPTIDDPSARTPDPIVRRVHGVHNGEHLESTFNIDPVRGDFRDYVHVAFPANQRNCTVCHVDDRYKTMPSRMACGACHDSRWFGDPAAMPADRRPHSGGPQADDSSCSVCHPADSGGVKAVAVAHKVAPVPFRQVVEVDISAPANGKFFVAGEAPAITIVVRDAVTGEVISPDSLVEPANAASAQSNELRRGNLFVSGPRSETRPVLTAAATDKTKTYANNDFRVLRDASKADPRITRTDTSTIYQLDDVAGLKPGTYSVWVETLPGPADALGDWELINFQVGTETPEKKVATNCIECHRDTRMHASYFAVEFNTDICKSCHDYTRQLEGRSGWTASNNGFGAAPIARRVHGVHFGRYLDKPEEVHSHDYSHVIFPQDVRNCTTCHAESPSWKEKPSRLACLACHDSDSAIAHAASQTLDLSPAEPYGGNEIETCIVCHGPGRDWSPDKVHNISSPYRPPYAREP